MLENETGDALLLGVQSQAGGKRRHPRGFREYLHRSGRQKLDELLIQGVADGDASAELPKLAVRKIVEEALEAEVAETLGPDYYENGAVPGAGYPDGDACSAPPELSHLIDFVRPEVGGLR